MRNIYTHEEIINTSIAAARKTINIISTTTGIPFNEIKQNMELRKDLGLKDLDIPNLTTDLEDSFDIKIPGEHSSKWKTVGDVVYYIARRLAGYKS
jgi:acyl carrier protein